MYFALLEFRRCPPCDVEFRKLVTDLILCSVFLLKAFMPDEVVQILNKCAAEIEQHLHAIIAPQTNQHVVTIHSLLDTLVQARISRDNMAALRLLHKVSFFSCRFIF